MRPTRILIGVFVLTALIAAGVGLDHVLNAHVVQPDSTAIAVVAYAAAVVALVSLIAHGWIAIRNSRKQHTMEVLLQRWHNPEFEKRAAAIQETFPAQAEINYDDLAQDVNKDVKHDVFWILNYYEFIATGIRHGDLDERLMRDCICTQFCTFCRRAETVIKAVRHEDEFGNPSVARKRVLVSVRWLQKRWQRKINRPIIPFWWPW